MIVLGIDPGTAITGYGLINYLENKIEVVDYGCIRTSPRTSLANRLCKISEELERLISNYQPEVVAVEELFFNKNVRTALAVGQARGVILLTAAKAGLEVKEYTPLQVKQALVGYGRAEKHQVQYMVKMLLDLEQVPEPDDVADALAIAICQAYSHNAEKKWGDTGGK